MPEEESQAQKPEEETPPVPVSEGTAPDTQDEEGQSTSEGLRDSVPPEAGSAGASGEADAAVFDPLAPGAGGPADTIPDGEEEDQEEEEDEDKDALGTQAEIEELSPTSRLIKGRVPEEKIRSIFKEYWAEIAESVQLRGFRKGRIPRRLLQRKVGSQVFDELKKNLKQAAISEVAKDHGLYVVGDPDFVRADLSEDAPFEFEVTCEVVPDFAIPPIDDIEVTQQPPATTEEEIDQQIERRREAHADWMTVDEWPPQQGDQLVVTAQVSAGPKTFQRSEGLELIVGQQQIFGIAVPDLPEQLTEGEKTISLQVQVPENHANERLRARRVQIDIAVQEVKRKTPPEVTDEWAGLFRCESVEKLREKIREELEASKKRNEEVGLGKRALEEILSRVEIPIPESVMKNIREQTPDAQAAEAPSFEEGSTAEGEGEEPTSGSEGDREQGAAPAANADEAVEEAVKDFRRQVLLDRIAEAQKIEVAEEELDAYLEAAQGVRGRELVEAKRQLEARGLLPSIQKQLLTVKVYDYLRSNCRIVGEDGQLVTRPEEEEAPADAEEAPAGAEQQPATAAETGVPETSVPFGADAPADDGVETRTTQSQEGDI